MTADHTTLLDGFDPNAIGILGNGLFGLPFTPETANTVIVSAPWEVTTSYGGGTAEGPTAIFEASFQVDLYHPDFPDAWQKGIAMSEALSEWKRESDRLKPLAQQWIEAQANGEDPAADPVLYSAIQEINTQSRAFADAVKQETGTWLDAGKKVGLLGGDHSTPLGYLEALAERHDDFGILHIDAHMDLRDAYEGFVYSHASIMFNALKLPQISRIVQIGIRDYCKAELDVVEASHNRIKVYTDRDIKRAQFSGQPWAALCETFLSDLPQKVYVSIDIDGLHPSLCPNTGTPVPGGFQFEDISFLLAKLASSGRQVIGFDLVEVSPGEDEWDANVGARMLFELFGYTAL